MHFVALGRLGGLPCCTSQPETDQEDSSTNTTAAANALFPNGN